MVPPDNHVHTEWSWDAAAGSMEESCARALELGLPSIAFTEHVDATRWVLTAEAQSLMPPERVGTDGRFDPLSIDTDGYFACVQRCRDRYPDLRILSGVELGEPHWFEDRSRTLLRSGTFDRVLGSLHSLTLDDGPWLVDTLFWASAPEGVVPDEIVRSYLSETLRMIESCDMFEVLAHIDYPVRGWPAAAGMFDPAELRGRVPSRAARTGQFGPGPGSQHPPADAGQDRRLVVRGWRRGGLVRQ